MGAGPRAPRPPFVATDFCMSSPILFAAGSLADTAKDTLLTFGVDWHHFIAQCISFAIVAFLLHRFAYKPVLAMLARKAMDRSPPSKIFISPDTRSVATASNGIARSLNESR